MRIDYKHVFLTTIAVATTSSLAQLGGMFGGEAKLSLGNGLGLNLSSHAAADIDGMLASSRINLAASSDMEMIDFNATQASFRNQIFAKRSNNVTIQAQFMDDMAEIRVFKPRMNAQPVSQWALHRLVGAREINATGNATLALFDANGASWSAAADVMYNGMSCTMRHIDGLFRFVSDPNVTVSVNVTAYIFNSDYTLSFKGENVTTSAQSVKFTYSIGSWPFAANSTGLSVFGLVKSSGAVNKTAAHNVVVSGSANMMISTVANADGAEVNISANVRIAAMNNMMRSAMLIELDFPVYQNTLEYDPVLGMEDDESSATSAPANTTAPVNNSTAPVDGGVSSVAVSAFSTLLLMALATLAA